MRIVLSGMPSRCHFNPQKIAYTVRLGKIMLSAQNISFSYGTRHLLQNLNFSLLTGERVALVGQNGEGKSTFMGILEGLIEPDEGSISMAPSFRIGMLTQEPRFTPGSLVADIVVDGCDNIEPYQIDEVLNRLCIEKLRNEKIDSLSGGEKRRVDLARVLITKPDILFLDEPTNHLDFESIDYLATRLKRDTTPVLFVSHDRLFVDEVATKIVELHHGKLFTHEPPYANYLENRLVRVDIDKRTSNRKSQLLKTELAWLRAGVKARTTKQKAHIERVYDLKDEVGARKADIQQKQVSISTGEAKRLAKTILEMDYMGFGYLNQQKLFEGLSLKIKRGDRIGIVGPNGSGKTSLLSLVMGKQRPTSGKLKTGPHTKFALFEQHRQSLNQSDTLKQVLCSQGDTVFVGDRSIHISSYLEQYLFDGSDMNRQVKTLSGGEQNRLLLAKLFAQPANFLIFDEPTNDLDATSLAVLEDTLLNLDGAAFIVSHDRSFLDRVCTSIIAFETVPQVDEEPSATKSEIFYNVGNYSYYLELKKQRDAAAKISQPKAKVDAPTTKPKPKRKRSYNEEREYKQIENKIGTKEARLEEIQEILNDGKIFAKDRKKSQSLTDEMHALEAEIPTLYDRWAELEGIGG